MATWVSLLTSACLSSMEAVVVVQVVLFLRTIQCQERLSLHWPHATEGPDTLICAFLLA